VLVCSLFAIGLLCRCSPSVVTQRSHFLRRPTGYETLVLRGMKKFLKARVDKAATIKPPFFHVENGENLAQVGVVLARFDSLQMAFPAPCAWCCFSGGCHARSPGCNRSLFFRHCVAGASSFMRPPRFASRSAADPTVCTCLHSWPASSSRTCAKSLTVRFCAAHPFVR
jgi:hypothetical protein